MAIASNTISITTEKDPGSHSHIAVLQLMPLRRSNLQPREGILNKVGQWMVENNSSNFYLFKDDYSEVSYLSHKHKLTNRQASALHLVYIESNSLFSQTLEIVPEAYTITAPESLKPSAEAISSALVAPPVVAPPSFLGPLPIPFKPKEESSSSHANTPKVISGRVLLGSPVPLGDLPLLEGGWNKVQIVNFNTKMVRGCIWNEHIFYVGHLA